MAKQKKESIVEIEDLKVVGKIIIKNWYLFILLPALSGAIAYFYTHRLEDIYASKTQILLKSEDSYGLEKVTYGNLLQNNTYEYTASQMRVIKSSDLIEETIEKLNLDVSYFIIGRIKTTEVYNNMPFSVYSHQSNTSSYNKEFRLDIIDTNQYQIAYQHGEEVVTNKYLFGETILDNGLFLRVDKNKNLNSQSVLTLSSIEYMFKVNRRQDLIQKYVSSLKIENIDFTSIIELILEDFDPERATVFLDTLSKVYIDYSLKNKIEINQNTIKYIDNQLEQVTKILESIESELENYKENKSILNLTREEDEYYNKLVTLEGEKNILNFKISSIEQLKSYILNTDGNNFLPPSFYIIENDEFLKTSINKLYDLQIRRSNRLFTGTDKLVTIGEIDNQINELRKNILTYLVNTKEFLDKEKQTLETKSLKYESYVKNIPKSQRQILNIERKLTVNEKMYLFLLEKRAEAVIARAAIIPETKVIEKV